MKTLDCRVAAAKCLAAVTGGSSLNQQLPLYEQQVVERDRPLLQQLCYGVLRFYPRLLGCSKQLLSKPLKDKDRDLLMLILLGAYQLQYTRIPDHAAVSATVNALQGLKKPWAKGLLNAVLRQWQRREQELGSALNPAAAAAHPDWLYGKINKRWPQQAEAIFIANNEQAPLCLRVNAQKTNRDAYLQQLLAAGISAQATAFSAQGIRLQQACPVEDLPGFADGLVSVQDEAAQLSADLLELAPGQRVLDSCCAPGGKTCHILESQAALSEVVAMDIDPERLAKVQQNLDRLGLQATLHSGDASQPRQWWDGQGFDRILLDAPCSATGVIRRNPDIKIHRQADDIEALSQLQLAILRAQWDLLKPGGILIYATCSVLPEENEKVVEAFCAENPQAQHCVIDADWGLVRPYGRQLFPQLDGHDGFYYAKLRKA
jgi:16S rRNA (cytosine967-C5)-methyltransferase